MPLEESVCAGATAGCPPLGRTTPDGPVDGHRVEVLDGPTIVAYTRAIGRYVEALDVDDSLEVLT